MDASSGRTRSASRNESTASVTYEKIAMNLENVAKELRAKHKARSVDFEVVMKNGKPVLKPVVKS